VVVDAAVADEARQLFISQGGYFLSPEESDALARVLVTPQRLPNPELVGKSATFIAARAGLNVPGRTCVLLAPLAGVGRDYPLSVEKLCPVLAFYVVENWQEGCERCKQLLRYGGLGHTMAIHSRNQQVIMEFGSKKPAFRICVNTPATLGAIGMTTGLAPAMTLGCGGYGGNITSDNITPRHLLNIKRLAFERLEPASVSPKFADASSIPANHAEPDAQVDIDKPVDFVCESDVRAALRDNRKILLTDHAIVTPAARDLGEPARIFVRPRPGF
jgi:acetaldehyde dehydrogenase (acetylating)